MGLATLDPARHQRHTAVVRDADGHVVTLPSGRTFDLLRSRWEGPLDEEQVEYCRANGVALGFDTSQIGWVLLASVNEDDDLDLEHLTGGATGAPSDDRLERAVTKMLADAGATLDALRSGAIDRDAAEQTIMPIVESHSASLASVLDAHSADRAHWVLLDRAIAELDRIAPSNRHDSLVRTDDRVRFRPWGDDDVAIHRSLLETPAVWEHLPEPYPSPYTDETSHDLIALANANVGHGVSAIELDGEVVGQCVVRFDRRWAAPAVAEVAYWLGVEHWGQGIMTRVLPRFVEHCFHEHGLDAVYAWIRRENAASARVAERAGFRRDRFAREAELSDVQAAAGFERWVLHRSSALRPTPAAVVPAR